MNGEIALSAQLVIHGNYVLAGRGTFNTLHSDWSDPHKEKLTFCEAGLLSMPKVVARSFPGWLKLLSDRGHTRLRLDYATSSGGADVDRNTSGFVGGGSTWVIESMTSSTSDIWASEWTYRGERIPPWDVAYYKFGSGPATSLIVDEEVGAETNRLALAVENAIALSRDHLGGSFIDLFQSGLAILKSSQAPEPSTLVPEGAMEPSAHRLINACSRVWVFGGMGSWNDWWSPDDIAEAHGIVSRDLFEAVNLAIVTAVNTTARRFA
jgi:hypothetical protein